MGALRKSIAFSHYEQGARSYEDAHKIASRISTSALFKTALYGEDAKYVFSPPPCPVVLGLTD